jgi:AraC family transcriptional regulator
MVIYIRHMVCVRCKMAVKSVLEKLGIEYLAVDLGKVELSGNLDAPTQKKLGAALKYYELELMDDKKTILVERIKILIIKLFHSNNEEIEPKFSEYLSKTLFHEYTYLANTFSELEGSTIERFYISTRIERVKELLVYESLSIKEIAFKLNYSSVSHLCLQFKKITGQTPSVFKKLFESGSLSLETSK